MGKSSIIKDINGTDVTNDSTSIGNINPYRYRGYRYDNETGMYYLQSRYYNTETGRMLNADSVINGNESLIEHNMFSYCSNNPVNKIDADGSTVWDIIDVVSYFDSVKNAYKKPSWQNVGWLTWDTIALLPIIPSAASIKLAVKAYKAANTIKATKSIKIISRSFSEILNDIIKNPRKWKKIESVIIKSTKKGNKGGFSIEGTYFNPKTGEKIYKHILKNSKGRLIEAPHYRPYGKQ